MKPDSNFLLPENDVQDKSHEMPKGGHLYWNTNGQAPVKVYFISFPSAFFYFSNEIKFQKILQLHNEEEKAAFPD